MKPSRKTYDPRMVELSNMIPGKTLYAPAILPGDKKRSFLIDSGASKSCIDVTVYDALPDPKPKLNPTKTKFRAVNGTEMIPKGIIHLPVTFYDGELTVKVKLPVYVCNLKWAGKCILGSDAGAMLNLKLDFYNGRLYFDEKYAKVPLNCTTGRADRPDAYQAKCYERTKIKAGCYAGVAVSTRARQPPKSWKNNAFVECAEELWDNFGLTIVDGKYDCTKGVGHLCVINPNDYDVVLRVNTLIGTLSPYEDQIEGTLPEELKDDDKATSVKSESSILRPTDSLFQIVGKDGKETFTEEQQRELYGIFGLIESNPDKNSNGYVSVKSFVDSKEDSMGIINYPDVVRPPVDKEDLPEALVKLLEDTKEGLDSEQLELVEMLITSMQETFMDPSTPLKGTSAVAHYIDTGDSRPIRIPPRRISPGKREIVEREVAKMLEAGVIRASDSPWSSPIVLVKKTDGTTRFCIDYRKLNDITRKNSYPLPRIDDHLEALNGKSWYCTLDLASGYWQIKMNEADKEKTAFASHVGLYEFNFMPFGLTNAPATFQTLMEEVLKGLIGKACLLYLDDIIVYGDTFQEVYDNLAQVMLRLRKYNLKLKAKKCSLFKKSVKFLGHVVSKDGVACNPDKIKAITDIMAPKDRTGVRSILGLGNYYRRFVKDYCLITYPMQQLTHQDKPFIWTPEHDESLRKLKVALTTAPILAYPDFSKGSEFIVDTDASDYQIGGVLSQIQDGKERVIMYASKGFQGSQLRWCTTRRELWAMVHMVTDVFKHYLERRFFTLRTDHSSLRWLKSFTNNANEALCRWLFYLEPFRPWMKVVHRPGVKHGNADGLSRIRTSTRSCPNPNCKDPGHKQPKKVKGKVTKSIKTTGPSLSVEEFEAIEALRQKIDDNEPTFIPSYTGLEMIQAQRKDPYISRFVQLFLDNDEKPSAKVLASESNEVRLYCALWNEMQLVDDILYRKSTKEGYPPSIRLVVPVNMREDIMRQMHDSVWAGHPGMSRMKSTVLARYYWPHITKDIESWIRCCDKCNRTKRGSPRSKFPLLQEISGAPFHRVSFDIIGPLPMSDNGNRFVLVMVDHFSKWAEAYAMPNHQAITVATQMSTRWFATHGIPLKLHSDNGQELKGHIMRELKSLLSVRGTFITPYRPKANGLCERTNQTIENIVMCMVGEDRHEWDEALPYALMAYRATPHSTTGFSPNMLVYGRENNFPPDIVYGRTTGQAIPQEYKCYCQFVTETRKNMIKSHEVAREIMGVAARRQKRIHDENTSPRSFKPGDVVWFFDKRLSTRPLGSGWTHKFVVVEKTGPANYRIARQEDGKHRVVHVDNLRLDYDQSKMNWIKQQKLPQMKAIQVNLPENSCKRSYKASKDYKESSFKSKVSVLTKKGKRKVVRRSARLARKRKAKPLNVNLVVKLPSE